MAEAVAAPVGLPHLPVLRRHVAAAVAGNALEFYDFTTYAYFAVQIGHVFFPTKTGFVSLILSLTTFGAGFLLRPVGAVVIGRYGDRVGRKPAMLFSLTLMGLAILGLALTPGYARIGVAAPILALFWRVIQGFALGGEVGPTTAFLVEAAPPRHRGLYGGWQNVSQSIALMTGGLVGVLLARIAGPQGLEDWGWRVAFLVGALILPFGYWLRRSLPETLHRAEAVTAAHPADSRLRGHVRILLLGLALIAAATVATYVQAYMTTYAITALHLPAGIALGAAVANGAAGIVGGLIGGVLCDRYGRKPFLIWPRLAMMLLALPAFYLMVRNHDALTLYGATAAISLTLGMSGPALIVSFTESLHKNVRGVALGTVYATAVAVFGGTTQPIIASLIHFTGTPLAPAWYLVAFNGLGMIAALMMRESAHAKLR